MTTYPGAILDVDGTLVRGDDLLPGARRGLSALRETGANLLLFSNNPTRPPGHYVERFAAHGVAVDPEQVLTSALVTATFLEDEYAESDLFVVGETYLHDLLESRGFALRDDPEDAEVVVASIDRAFDYDCLTEALRALEGGAAFVGTDPDRVIPTSDRFVPGSGAIVNAIAGVAGRDPDHVLGKPSAAAGAAALSLLGVEPADCLVVGDRLDTDVALGERLGATTALVCTGVASREDVEQSDVQPDYVLESLAEVGELLE